MVMVYEIWDTESGNRVAEYATEGEALAMVRMALASVPRDELLPWALARCDADGELEPVAEGEALIDLALSVSA
jgi:hypothetical protein